jgi:hypothetical protein
MKSRRSVTAKTCKIAKCISGEGLPYVAEYTSLYLLYQGILNPSISLDPGVVQEFTVLYYSKEGIVPDRIFPPICIKQYLSKKILAFINCPKGLHYDICIHACMVL